MSSTEAPPFAVVICHGSYHTPAPYQLFVSTLKAQGIEAYCPQLPSSDLRKMNVGDISKPDYDREPPVGGYPQPNDDAIVLNQLLSELITKSGKNVILVGHSAGAFTATMVAVPEFQARIRNERGEKGGIIGIFYECGFLIPVGESTHSFFQPKDGSEAVIPPYCQFHVGSLDIVAFPIINKSLSCPRPAVSNIRLICFQNPETRLCRRRFHKRWRKLLLQWSRRRHSQTLRGNLDSIRKPYNCSD